MVRKAATYLKRVELRWFDQWLMLFSLTLCPPLFFRWLLAMLWTLVIVIFCGALRIKVAEDYSSNLGTLCAYLKVVGALDFVVLRIWIGLWSLSWGWHFLADSDLFWVRCFRDKYCKGKSFIEAESSSKDSWLWKGIIKSKDVLLKGSCFLIGDGSTVNFWKDSWVPFIQGFRPTPWRDRRMGVNMVSDLIIFLYIIWNSFLIIQVFELWMQIIFWGFNSPLILGEIGWFRFPIPLVLS